MPTNLRNGRELITQAFGPSSIRTASNWHCVTGLLLLLSIPLLSSSSVPSFFLPSLLLRWNAAESHCLSSIQPPYSVLWHNLRHTTHWLPPSTESALSLLHPGFLYFLGVPRCSWAASGRATVQSRSPKMANPGSFSVAMFR